MYDIIGFHQHVETIFFPLPFVRSMAPCVTIRVNMPIQFVYNIRPQQIFVFFGILTVFVVVINQFYYRHHEIYRNFESS